jgi:hypothetical protein
MAGNASEEEAAWRDLVAQYRSPPAPDGAPVPWPAREDLPAPSGGRPSLAAPGTAPGAPPSAASSGAPTASPGAASGAASGPASSGAPGAVPGGAPGTGDEADDGQQQDDGARPTAAADPLPGIIPAPPQVRIVRPAAPVPQPPSAADDTDDQFVPPVPPPLPRLDPVSKGAWAALFGGPGYLMIAVMTGWQVPGWAAFLSVAAFVGGFTTLVIRMGERPPRDSGPDDGAVV